MKARFFTHSLTIVVLGITSRIEADQEIWKITNLNLIIPGHIVKEYGVLRPDSHWESVTPKENRKLRKEICEKLLKTPYFVKYHQRWIDTDSEEEREYVVNSYPNTIPSNFENKQSSRLSSWFSNKMHYRYDSAYRLVKTDVNCAGRESANWVNVFPCLVERSLFKMDEEVATKVDEYYVSEPFHVDIPHFKVTDIVGRIVFYRSAGTEISRIEAFAAHPDRWLRELKIVRSDVENRYGLYDVEKLGNRT